jgi:hypothetical protein
LLGLTSDKNFVKLGFVPRLMLTEASKNSQSIDSAIRDRLLDLNSWYLWDLTTEDGIEFFSCFRREYQEILEGVLAVFRCQRLDCKLGQFAADLYFLKGMKEDYTDPFSVSFFMQLVS